MNQETPKRHTGKVKWFDNSKGYGFIRNADGNAEYFAHRTRIEQNDKFQELKDGQVVSFEVYEDSRKPGKFAADKIRIEE
jgi:CspA family cold shock protein